MRAECLNACTIYVLGHFWNALKRIEKTSYFVGSLKLWTDLRHRYLDKDTITNLTGSLQEYSSMSPSWAGREHMFEECSLMRVEPVYKSDMDLRVRGNTFVHEVTAVLDARIGRDTSTSNEAGYFFRGKAGTGKTFPSHVRQERAESKGHVTLICATTEKAALL